MGKIFEKIIKISLYLLIFLLPLFFLPFSFEAYEFNKIYLIFFLVSVAFLVWLAKMILVEKEIRFKKSPLDIPVLLFLFFAILSAIFSVDKNSSLLGFYGRFSNGLILLLSLGALYFLIINNVSMEKTARQKLETETGDSLGTVPGQSLSISAEGILKAFLWSIFFVILISYFSVLGVWQKIGISKFQYLGILGQRTFNPVSGSLEGLAIFLSIVTVLLVGRSLGWREGKLSIIINYLLLLGVLGLLVIVDFFSAWLILAISLILFLIFALATRIFRENVNRLLLPIFLIIFSLVFLFINPTRTFLAQLPQEQILGQGISWRVAFSAMKENWKSIFLGSGIGNFNYDFAKFKPIEFNKSLWWQIRYDRAGNQLAEIFGTMGFLGLISYLVLIGIFFLVSYFLYSKPETREKIFLPLTLLVLFVSQFFYYQNAVLAFLFWLILGLGVVSWQKPIQEKVFSFKDFPELSLVFSTLFILLFFGVFLSYYFGIRFYLADVDYLRAQMTTAGEERVKILERVIGFNPNFVSYRIILARNYLALILNETSRPLAEQDATKIQNWVARAINEAKISSDLSPNSVAAWETLGMIYRDIQPLAQGATDWAIKSFQKAIELEPKNPVLYTELGKMYLTSDVKKARENFAKAKELKSDYIDALIQDALTFEREQNLDEAIKKMEELVTNYPFNIEARFQLGRLYFNKDRLDDAISQFEQVILIFPNHSNSLYSLGLAYSKKGEKEKAISAFEKVLQLNPDNQDVIKKLEELKKK